MDPTIRGAENSIYRTSCLSRLFPPRASRLRNIPSGHIRHARQTTTTAEICRISIYKYKKATGNRRENHRRVENPAATAFHDSTNRVLTRTYSSLQGFKSRLFKHFASINSSPFLLLLLLLPLLLSFFFPSKPSFFRSENTERYFRRQQSARS